MSNASTTAPSKPGFLKEHVLPLFFIFLIPGFSLWFFGHAENHFDGEIRDAVFAKIQSDRTLSAEEQAQAKDFWANVRVSKIMASNRPEAAELQSMFEPSQFRYAVFRWCKRTSLVCIGSALFTFVFVGLSAAYSMRSQAAQYRALRLGMPVLRGVAVIQVVGQGILAVALSFWVTVLWTESYYPKLILIAALLAVLGVWVLLKAIFTKPQSRFEQAGELVREEDAPGLWQRVRDIAGRLGTAPPDQIIAGIDASFFVTEHDVALDDSVQSGRTLFVSLPLLKVMTVEEADAVLAHEMAHFSGEDTLWSRRISPLLQKMAQYLNALYAGGLSRPVFHFMHFFWKLYQLSLGRMSRLREFRADGIGARESSPGALARALVKVGAYCRYRGKTENEILAQREVASKLELAERLDRGFPAFLTGFTSGGEAAQVETPHPFDTHPPLERRMEALGLQPAEVLRDPAVQEPVSRSWRDAVLNADAIEARLWDQQEQAMQKYHEKKLAWTLMPRNETDLALVLKHFPDLSFQNGKGETARLTHAGLQLSSWPRPIPFTAFVSLELKESFGTKILTLSHRTPDSPKVQKVKFNPATFKSPQGDLLAALGTYYGRHQTAVANQA